MKPLLIILLFMFWAELMAQPEAFNFTPSTSSAAFISEIRVDGQPAESGSWIAAFGPDGNCAGAAALIIFEGKAYATLTIYGDDATTPGTDEGLLPGDSFSLQLYRSAETDFLDYPNPGEPAQLGGWFNNNGAPLPGYNDPTAVYHFISTLPLSYTVDSAPPACHDSMDGWITVAGTGGLPPLAFAWNDGGSGSSRTNLGAGTYICTITDANGAAISTGPVEITAPPPLLMEFTTSPPASGEQNGSASVTVSGGTPPYTYLWSDQEMQSTAQAQQLWPGEYFVTVSDAKGCTVVRSIVLGEVNSAKNPGSTKRGIFVFPNPLRGEELWIRLSPEAQIQPRLFVYSLSGQQVEVVKLEATGLPGMYRCRPGPMPGGAYQLLLLSQKESGIAFSGVLIKQ